MLKPFTQPANWVLLVGSAVWAVLSLVADIAFDWHSFVRSGAVVAVAGATVEFRTQRNWTKFEDSYGFALPHAYKKALDAPGYRESDDYVAGEIASSLMDESPTVHSWRSRFTTLGLAWLVVGSLIWAYGDLMYERLI